MRFATATAFSLACAGLLTGATEDDRFAGAVEVLHYSFESDEDRDFDGQPDDWTRRTGPGFPEYVESGIDRTRGRHGSQSLKFKVNGGQAIVYSPPARIDPRYAYVFQGFIRTQSLEHDAALISLSFLNHQRQRVQRSLSRPVSGTHQGWVRVRIGPVALRPDVRFVVIGCHLLPGKKMDVRGSVWFDDLWLGKLPRLSLENNLASHFQDPSAETEITSRGSGLDPDHAYRLRLQMSDAGGTVVAETTRPLQPGELPGEEPLPDEQGAADSPADVPAGSFTVNWRLPPQEPGYYLVQSTLMRDGIAILNEETSLAVMDLLEEDTFSSDDDRTGSGEFGWSITRPLADSGDNLSFDELADVAFQAGIHRLKYPLWESVHSGDNESPAQIGRFFDRLQRRGILPVGVLRNPPPELRSKFARDWTGISELFTMPLEFWEAALGSLIARYSSNVRHWQLGDDEDQSFVGLDRLPEMLAVVKREFDRIGRDTRVGVPWDWDAALPAGADLPRTFLSLGGGEQADRLQLVDMLEKSADSRLPRWVLLKPQARSQHTTEERAVDLVKHMVAARRGGAEAIFAGDIFDDERGLMNPDGSPTPLFLPWRTAALALQGTEFLGSLNLPGGSRNFVFARQDEVVLFAWNEQPTTEELYLGEDVVLTDMWGRKRPATVKYVASSDERDEGQEGGRTKCQVIEIGPAPVIIRGCSEPVARWRLAVQFEKGQAPSAYGEHEDAVTGVNTFPLGMRARASLELPAKWEVQPRNWSVQEAAGEAFNLPFFLTLPPNARLGTEATAIEFEIMADRAYRFRVFRPYGVGLGDLALEATDRQLDDGRLEIEQLMVNGTSPEEVLNFRCSLFIPGHRRQKTFVTRLGNGRDRKLYHLPDAEALRGRELWLRAEQINGPRVLNYRWTVGRSWQERE